MLRWQNRPASAKYQHCPVQRGRSMPGPRALVAIQAKESGAASVQRLAQWQEMANGAERPLRGEITQPVMQGVFMYLFPHDKIVDKPKYSVGDVSKIGRIPVSEGGITVWTDPRNREAALDRLRRQRGDLMDKDRVRQGSEDPKVLDTLYREAAIRLMGRPGLHGVEVDSPIGYPHEDQKRLFHLHSDYWTVTDPRDAHFVAKKGVEPADAVRAIFSEEQMTTLECHSMMVSIQYRALLHALGDERFNKLFEGTRLEIASGPGMIEDSNLHKLMTSKKLDNPEELKPGDWLYYKNFEEYSAATLYDQWADWAGLHTMYMGGGQYQGFGLSESVDDEGMKKKLLEAYNEDFEATPRTAADLPKMRGLYTKERVRPYRLTEEGFWPESYPDWQDGAPEEGDGCVFLNFDDTIDHDWKEECALYMGSDTYNTHRLGHGLSELQVKTKLMEKFNKSLPERKKKSDLEGKEMRNLSNVRAFDMDKVLKRLGG